MANRFFDYMHAGVPQVCVDFPEYRKANEQAEIAVLVGNTQPKTIATALKKILNNSAFHEKLQKNSLILREEFCWQTEELKLENFYYELFAR
jgi:glycosyltransferase involved in cell wall biosynthesis